MNVEKTSSTVVGRDLCERRVAVAVEAVDPVSRAGLASQLRQHRLLDVVEDADGAVAAVLAVDAVDDRAVRSLRSLIRHGCVRIVLVATALDDMGVLRAVEAGASAILRRAEVTPERLAAVLIAAVAGHGTLPPDLLGPLLAQVGELQRSTLGPRGMNLNGFRKREIEVLRLIAEGFDTAEVAAKLAYSERTVKNVLHDVTTRFNLRNRCHAVAYALRVGAI